MSTDASFVPRAVPVLRSDRVAEVEAAASARGYAAGYAAGARAARDEAERLRAALEADHARRTAERDERTARAVAVLREAARALGERTVPVVAAAQDATVRGALDLAGSVLGYELTDRPGAARAALARATAVADGAVVAVRLLPADESLRPAGGDARRGGWRGPGARPGDTEPAPGARNSTSMAYALMRLPRCSILTTRAKETTGCQTSMVAAKT